ncbi:MAG: pyridoxamine kinase [Lachnospiraceae bacterium]|nr:pyridoxamine kinase [Lachnospiraceae bacterium]
MNNTKKIVSVQDISCFGQCSLTVALPVLSAYGIETAILPSAILSTHTGGFKNYTVLDLTDEMPKIVRHWHEENIKFDAIYTGYIGDTRQFSLIKDMRSLLNPGGLLLVDPAMADFGKLYSALDNSIVDGMKSLICEADVICPNITEAAFLLGKEYCENPSAEQVKSMLRDLCSMGPKISIMTGVSPEDGKIGAMAYDAADDKFTEFYSERVPHTFHGTGDVFASVLFANIINGKPLSEALEDACEFVVKAINETVDDPSHGYGVRFEQVINSWCKNK